MDLFEWANKTCLLIIDYFSRYIEVAELRVTSSEATVCAVNEAFAHHGYPEIVVSDNGPQFSSETCRTAKVSCFAHVTSSHRYPQVNGEAKRVLQTVKCLCKKDTDWAVTNGKKPAHKKEGRHKQATHCNLCHHSRTFQELTSGQNVWITTEKAPGTVLGTVNMPRSYLVENEKGILRRNRIHLRAIVNSSEATTRSGRVSRPPERLDL